MNFGLVKKIRDRSASKPVQIRRPHEGKRDIFTDETNLLKKSLLQPIEPVQLNELKPILNSEGPATPRKVQPVAMPPTMKSSEASKFVRINQDLGAEELMYTERARGYIESGGTNMETKRTNIVYKPQGPPRDGRANADLFRTKNETNFVSFAGDPVGLRENEEFLKIPVRMKSSNIYRAPSTLPPSLFDAREKTSLNHLDEAVKDASLHASLQESAKQTLRRTRSSSLHPTNFSQVTALPITNEFSGTSDTAWVQVAAPFARASRRKPSLQSLTFLQENMNSFVPTITIDDAALRAIRPVENAVSLRKKMQLTSLVQGLTESNPIASAAIASAAAAMDPKILSVNGPHRMSNKAPVALDQRPLRLATDNAVDLADETETGETAIKSVVVSRASNKASPSMSMINFNPTTTATTMADAVGPDQLSGYTNTTIARNSNKTHEMNVEMVGKPNAVAAIDAMSMTGGIATTVAESKSSTKKINVSHTTNATATPVDSLEVDGASTVHLQSQNRSSTKQTPLTRTQDATLRVADWERAEVSDHVKLTESHVLLRDAGKRPAMADPLRANSIDRVHLDGALTESEATTMPQFTSSKPKSFDPKRIDVEKKPFEQEFKGTILESEDFRLLASPLVADEKVRGAQTKHILLDRQLRSVNVSEVLPELTSDIPETELKRSFTAQDVVIT